MTQSFTMCIYKRDRRCRTGERLFSVTVWPGRTVEGMHREMRELTGDLYPGGDWRFEFRPTMRPEPAGTVYEHPL